MSIPKRTEEEHQRELARTREISAELLHELEVHRLELQMQNEQLRESESALSDARDRYFDLFDLAPVAYLTVDRDGAILEANFAAASLLGEERSKLLGRKIVSFVGKEHAGDFHLFHKGLYQPGSSHARELSCTLGDARRIPVRMLGIAPASAAGERDNARITIVDLSEIARVQRDLAKQEVELKRSEDRLANFMRTTNDCVLVLAPSGAIKAVNPATLALLGFDEEQLVGKHIASLDHGAVPRIGSKVRSAEITWVDVHGGTHTVLLTISPITEAISSDVTEYLCVAQDITERKEAEEKLRVSESLLRQMAETIEDGLYVQEYPSGRLSYVSPAYEQIFGISGDALEPKPGPPWELVHPDDVERVRQAYSNFMKGDPCDVQFRINGKGGEIRWIRERSFLVEEAAGKVERIVSIAQDITDQRQFELELRQGQKMEAIGQLASGVAHDFNNILMGIHGCASIGLSKLSETSDVRPFLEAIRKSSESGTAIVKQLLVFSSKREIQVQSFELNEVILSDETMLTRLLGDDVMLRIVPSKVRCPVRMDLGQVEQILMNLAINARDAMPEGGELIIEVASVGEVDGPQGVPPYVELRVKDTGVGMSEEVQERIFEPFYTTKGIGEGTGLGLSTVYGIVQEAGGTIRCSSQPGEGTTFIVRLPRAEDDFVADATVEPEPTPSPQRETCAGSVLVVEDEDVVRLTIKLYLEDAGFQVLEASNGAEALEILDAQSQSIALLLTDVGLPGVSGAALAGRARECRSDLPIIFMSAHPADWLIGQGRLATGEEALQKPFSKSQLVHKVRGVLGLPLDEQTVAEEQHGHR